VDGILKANRACSSGGRKGKEKKEGLSSITLSTTRFSTDESACERGEGKKRCADAEERYFILRKKRKGGKRGGGGGGDCVYPAGKKRGKRTLHLGITRQNPRACTRFFKKKGKGKKKRERKKKRIPSRIGVCAL